METTNASIAVISSTYFKWRAQAEYKETVPTLDDAILYASRLGYNLIVKYERRSGPQFDVLLDPNLDCVSREKCEFVQALPTVAEMHTERSSWRHMMRRHIVGLAELVGAVEVRKPSKTPIGAARRQALAAK